MVWFYQRTLPCRREALIAIQCHMANVWAARKVIVFAEVAASPQIGLVAMYQIPAVFELCRTTVLL